MAAVVSSSSHDAGQLGSVFDSRFGPAERQQMRQEDSQAFRTVSLELVSIVVLGFVLIGGTATAILLTS